MTTLTVTEARRLFFELVRDANEKHEVFTIRHRKGSAVLLSEDDYENLIETLNLLSIPGFRDSIKRSTDQVEHGETVSFDALFNHD